MDITESLVGVGFAQSAICSEFWGKEDDPLRAVLPVALPEGTRRWR